MAGWREWCVVPAQLPGDHFELWRRRFVDDHEEESRAPNIRTHLAFDFHGVAVSAPERLRLVKTPIHFPGCRVFFFFVEALQKSSARLCPQKVGLCFPTIRSDSIRPIRLRTLGGFVDFISRRGLVWLFPDVCPSDRSELSARKGGDRLAALTRE